VKKFLIVVCSVVVITSLLVACGGTEELVSRVINSNVGGCQIEKVKPNNLRVGLLGYSADWSKVVEITSVAINIDSPGYTLTLDSEIEKTDLTDDETDPYDILHWVDHLGGSVHSTELVVRAYLDKNGDGVYSIEADGPTIGTPGDTVIYFDAEYADKNARFGYNLQGGEGYNQKFAEGNFYIPTYGCD